MSKKKRQFLCSGCRGYVSGKLAKGSLIRCSYAEANEVRPKKYSPGMEFESCPHRTSHPSSEERERQIKYLQILANTCKGSQKESCFTKGASSYTSTGGGGGKRITAYINT